jgi:uncharacterized membrane protein YeaQ/YmgE (transglycosylase-associated protein family)
MKALIVFASIAISLFAASVSAQALPEGLNTEHLSTVFVTDKAGVQTEAKLLRLDGDGLEVIVGGAEKHYAFAELRRVEKKGDSLKNGAIAGLVVGGIIGVLSGAMSENAADTFGIAMTSTMLYGAIGTCMDAMVVGRTTLYQQSVAHQITPTAGPRAAVKFSVTW